MKTDKTSDTIEIPPNEFETLEPENIKKNVELAGFFHSLGRAIGGEKIDNKFLKTN